ncbi:MAG: 5-(carboxyamino)imidazole ribonucleotide mutase [Verrucomicrobiae bacterium]|nr:5-(carboxyamino)imidazole ribonucleotide mutase [Verrucomicrobiae bacterium]
MPSSLVAILMGSDSDFELMERCHKTLDEFGIVHETRVMSAHRTPDTVAEYVRGAPSRGIRVFIAAAGGAAHLAGAVAAQTTLPVIGVPLDATEMKGLDALLSTVQMPPGIPVATVAIGKFGATNAAVLAAQILATSDPALAKKLVAWREALRRKVEAADRTLQAKL